MHGEIYKFLMRSKLHIHKVKKDLANNGMGRCALSILGVVFPAADTHFCQMNVKIKNN